MKSIKFNLIVMLKFALEQAVKTQTENRGIALLFLQPRR